MQNAIVELLKQLWSKTQKNHKGKRQHEHFAIATVWSSTNTYMLPIIGFVC